MPLDVPGCGSDAVDADGCADEDDDPAAAASLLSPFGTAAHVNQEFSLNILTWGRFPIIKWGSM